MAKYKLLTQLGYSFNHFRSGEIYDEEYISISGTKLKSLIEEFPSDWRLVEENPKYVNFNGIIYEVEDWTPHSYCKLKDLKLRMGLEPFKHLVTTATKEDFIKQQNMCTEKTIIGYKLKDNLWENNYRKQSFIEGVCSIGVIHGSKTITNIEESTNPRCPAVLENFKAAKVLDLWFIPVYKSEYPDITINGYKGEFFDNYVKFGCAEIHKQLFLELYAVKDSTWTNGREIESVTIGKGTFTKDQIKEIAECYLNSNLNIGER